MRKIWIFGIVMLFLCSLAYAYPAAMDFEINPCVSEPWGNHTPLSISITAYACNHPTDPWNYCDKVTAKATIYFADGNIQTDETYWGNFYNSHTEFVFDTSKWSVNKTGNFSMRLYVKSNDTLYTANYTDLDFEVVNKTWYDSQNRSDEYVWYGDCVTTGVVGVGGTNVTGGEDAISIAFEGVEEQYGWGATLLWILVMVVVAVVMWFFTDEFGSAAGLGVVILVEMCLLIVGMYLGFISAWLLYILLFIGTMVVAINTYKMIGGKK